MKGTARRRKMAARFGPKWWDRNGHISFWNPTEGWTTWGCSDPRDEDSGFVWPRPAQCCVDIKP